MWRILASCILGVSALPVFAQPEPPVEKAGSEPERPKEPFGTLAGGRPLPPGAFARLGSPRMRTRTDYANGLQFSPDGQRLIVAAGRDDLWWFDPAAGKPQFHHEYPVRNIKCGRLLDDGTLVLLHARGIGDKNSYFVLRFDPATGKVAADDPIKVADVNDGEFDNRATAVVVTHDKTVAVYDTKTGEQRWRLTRDAKSDVCPKFLTDAKVLVHGADGRPAVHDARTGKELLKLESPTGEQSDAAAFAHPAVSPDGKFVAAATGREWIHVWDADTGKVAYRLGKHRRPLGFRPDGHLFAAGAEDTLSVWTAEGKRECEFPFPHPDKAILSPDGKRLAVAMQDTVLVYDVPTAGPPTLASSAADLPGLPDQLRFDPDGTLVGRLPGWNGWAVWKDRKPEPHLLVPPAGDGVVGLSTDRRRVLSLRDGSYLTTGLTGDDPSVLKQEVSATRSMADLSADGRTIVVAHPEGLTRFDLSTRKSQLLRSRFKDRGAGTAAVISADGRTAATEGYDPVTDARYVEIFSLVTNKPVREVPIRGPLDRMVITPDGRRLALAFITNSPQSNLEKNLVVVDPETGAEVLKLGPMHKGDDLKLALSPDGRTVAWHIHNELRVYELLTGQVRAKLPTPKNDLHGLALAGDGRTLAAAGPGWPVVLWDLAGGLALRPLAAPREWDDAWAALEKPDATAAYHAARRMVLTPTEAVAFFRRKLTPTVPPAPGVLAKWIDKLDAPAFADRQAAVKELRGFDELAVPDLKRTLDATDSAETRQRIEGLLAGVRKPTPEAVRAARAVEALEWLGTADAKTLLKALAAGAEGARQTQEASAALRRMRP